MTEMSAASTPPGSAEALALLHTVFTDSFPERTLPGPDEPLFGPAAQLDSMELVAFIADVEEQAARAWRKEVILADEAALSRRRSPFRNLTALAEYLVEQLQDG